MTNQITDAAARALLRDYAHALDQGVLAEWPTFFTDPCIYRITTRENEERGFPLSIMLCNNRPMLLDRIEATEKANIFEPHYYRHILSDTKVVQRGADTLRTRTSFLCVRIMGDGSMMLFACGEYVDDIVCDNGRCLYRSKTVVLDQSRVDTLIAIPL